MGRECWELPHPGRVLAVGGNFRAWNYLFGGFSKGKLRCFYPRMGWETLPIIGI